MENIADLVDKLLQVWSQEEVAFLPSASKDEIRLFEDTYGVTIPDDMRYYLERVNGMTENMWDGAMIAFHHLSRIVPLYEEMKDHLPEHRSVLSVVDDPKNLFIFADYLISSHYYVIRLFPTSNSGPHEVMWVDTNEYATLGGSFTDFLVRYISDRDSIIFPELHK